MWRGAGENAAYTVGILVGGGTFCIGQVIGFGAVYVRSWVQRAVRSGKQPQENTWSIPNLQGGELDSIKTIQGTHLATLGQSVAGRPEAEEPAYSRRFFDYQLQKMIDEAKRDPEKRKKLESEFVKLREA